MLKLLLISVPFLFLLGSLFHFAYEFSKKKLIVGLFTPVNESMFEHSKLLLVPLSFFYFISYFFVKDCVDINNYFLAMLVSIVFSIITMVCFYYTYKEIIGKSYLWVDIFDLFLSLFIGQVLANHVYEYSGGIYFVISISLVILIFIVYIYLTFKPFKVPFFYDKKNKIYGINNKR